MSLNWFIDYLDFLLLFFVELFFLIYRIYSPLLVYCRNILLITNCDSYTILSHSVLCYAILCHIVLCYTVNLSCPTIFFRVFSLWFLGTAKKRFPGILSTVEEISHTIHQYLYPPILHKVVKYPHEIFTFQLVIYKYLGSTLSTDSKGEKYFDPIEVTTKAEFFTCILVFVIHSIFSINTFFLQWKGYPYQWDCKMSNLFP